MANSNGSYRKQNPSPAVVSAGCLRFKSYLSLCRLPSHRQPPSLPPAPLPQPTCGPSAAPDGEAAAQAYWRRARELEQELRKLDAWLSTEKGQTECPKNTTVMTVENGHTEMTRLSDGSYLHEIKKPGRPWGRLAMQVSAPLIAENATAAAEVIRGMASLRRGELCECLHESMPMSNLSGRHTGEIKGKRVVTGAEEHFVEAVLLGSVEKMEGLALEGLRIQMGGGGRAAAEVVEKKAEAGSKERMVLVMLVQVRDPRENYEAVGEAMIGLIEASAAGEGGSSRLDVQGLHVAGMKSVQARSEGRDLIWSTSLRGCKGCCLQYVRNPDRFFA
ncbi:hypothetical protein MUK42_10488 [Musa troglodytarum]|uniref:Uncharacterized protein n=1 Tax=Musa troglodytarum TaxID=320322 RepID=A0A9E7GNA2_9LILI|nr:hypothetical protein MUK42_10488 [Musa troglodytarum]